MKKYWVIARTAWSEYLAYRMNFLLEIIGGLFAMLIAIAVWYAIFQGDRSRVIGNYTLDEMVTYLLGAGIVMSFLFLTAQGDEINDDINRGTLSNYLVKPLIVPLYWAIRDLVRKYFTLALALIQFLIVLLFFRGFLVGPASPFHLLLAVAALIFAAVLHFLLFYAFSVIAFWMEETWGWRFLMRVVMEIATGALIPIALFPDLWRGVFEFLPFQYLVYFPMQVYLGKVGLDGVTTGVGTMFVWIAILAIAVTYVWRRGLARYTAQGG